MLRIPADAFEREPEDQPYGRRDFDIRDPDGHVIGAGQEKIAEESCSELERLCIGKKATVTSA